MFKDRIQAGQQLASVVPEVDCVFAIPRGGVPIAIPIAQQQEIPLGLVFPRKLRAPNQAEFAIGAINESGHIMINQSACDHLNVSDDYMKQEIQIQLDEIKDRQSHYPSQNFNIQNKRILLVDDGIATGLTMQVAIEEIKSQQPAQMTVAVPVSAKDSYEKIARDTQIICLGVYANFGSVGAYYEHFDQVSTEEVLSFLSQTNRYK